MIWALSVLGFLYAEALSIPSYTVPLALLCFMILFLVNPTRTFHHEARFWLLKKLVSCMCMCVSVPAIVATTTAISIVRRKWVLERN